MNAAPEKPVLHDKLAELAALPALAMLLFLKFAQS